MLDIGDGWAVTFKAESHNHPSYVEPFQGAATGVGGIVRDILAMGARPLAVMDSLRVGAPDAPDTKRVLPGVVAGVGGYGNCLGLPNIGGEVIFDASYAGNPLVNALCVGAMRIEDLHLAHASGAGNKIILFGARTGLDGIGGASVLASDTFSGGTGRKKLPSVQVGDPFAEKVLIECCLELFAAKVVVGISDLGAAGLACATSELASAGDGGMTIDLDRVPLRAKDMSAAEILSSESQERMCAVVTPEHVDAFLAICAEVGRDRDRDRRGHRGRHAGDHLARPHRRRRAAAHRRPRRPGLPAPDRPPEHAGRVAGQRARRARPSVHIGRTAGHRAAHDLQREPVLAQVGHPAVRPLRARWHRAGPAVRLGHDPHRRADPPRRRAVGGLQLPLRARSTRTRARSWRWPRRTATSRQAARGRWRSPTA